VRLLLIIFDGLGDRPAPELGGLTPLEAAHTPNIDRFAAEGINGLLQAKSPGYVLGSPLALHLMFGYPEDSYPGRGPLLATARGHAIAGEEVVHAARFAVAERDGRTLMLRERFIRGREEACEQLASAIASYECGGLRFRYEYSGRGDGLLFISSADPNARASFEVTDTDPLVVDQPVLRARARAAGGDEAAAERTAEALCEYLEWAHATLTAHEASALDGVPINALITKWAGPRPAYEPFEERWGMRPFSLPDEEVVSGLLLEMGFELAQEAGTDPESDLRVRLEGARQRLVEGYEFVHVHTKYPDPMSHDNEPEVARDAIEALDRAMEFYWSELANDESVVTVLTTDHTTPSVWAEHPRGKFNDLHGGEPGPIAIRGGNVRVDGVTAYGERAAAAGGLGHLVGADFMPVLLNAAERAHMWEMHPTRVHRAYKPAPGGLEPLQF
jgi:2,3-bisphosphoglycerate-independent phosphoglycerate mutase